MEPRGPSFPVLNYDRLHGETGSVLARPLYIPAYELSALTADIEPQLDDILSYRGCTETHTALRDIRLSRPGILASDTYRALLDKPMHFGRAQITFDTEFNEKRMVDCKLLLRNDADSGCAELSLFDYEHDTPVFYLQQANSINDLSRSNMLPLDEAAAMDILRDILLQSHYNPSQLKFLTDTALLLQAFVHQATTSEIIRQAVYGWDIDDGEGRALGHTEAGVLHRTEQTAHGAHSAYDLTLTSQQPFGHGSNSKTRLELTTATGSEPTAKLKAGIEATTFTIGAIALRDTLFQGTIAQYQEPGVFAQKIRAGAARLISPFNDIDRLA